MGNLNDFIQSEQTEYVRNGYRIYLDYYQNCFPCVDIITKNSGENIFVRCSIFLAAYFEIGTKRTVPPWSGWSRLHGLRPEGKVYLQPERLGRPGLLTPVFQECLIFVACALVQSGTVIPVPQCR